MNVVIITSDRHVFELINTPKQWIFSTFKNPQMFNDNCYKYIEQEINHLSEENLGYQSNFQFNSFSIDEKNTDINIKPHENGFFLLDLYQKKIWGYNTYDSIGTVFLHQIATFSSNLIFIKNKELKLQNLLAICRKNLFYTYKKNAIDNLNMIKNKEGLLSLINNDTFSLNYNNNWQVTENSTQSDLTILAQIYDHLSQQYHTQFTNKFHNELLNSLQCFDSLENINLFSNHIRSYLEKDILQQYIDKKQNNNKNYKI